MCAGTQVRNKLIATANERVRFFESALNGGDEVAWRGGEGGREGGIDKAPALCDFYPSKREGKKGEGR